MVTNGSPVHSLTGETLMRSRKAVGGFITIIATDDQWLGLTCHRPSEGFKKLKKSS